MIIDARFNDVMALEILCYLKVLDQSIDYLLVCAFQKWNIYIYMENNQHLQKYSEPRKLLEFNFDFSCA